MKLFINNVGPLKVVGNNLVLKYQHIILGSFCGGRTLRVLEKGFTRSVILKDFFGLREGEELMSSFRWHSTSLFSMHFRGNS